MIDFLMSGFYLVLFCLGALVFLVNLIIVGCIVWFAIWVRMINDDNEGDKSEGNEGDSCK